MAASACLCVRHVSSLLARAAPAVMAVSVSALFMRLCVVCAAYVPILEVTSLFLRDSLSLCGVDVLSERVVRKVVVPDATKLCESL